ncbi:MAG: magnesium transporter CorA family protein [Chloroflexi bacterium]|nr:magnesium transporter CorA family protein [Chloroflexota bacterium]
MSEIAFGDLTWTYIERPAQREMENLARNHPYFHPLNLDDCLSRIQRPKIDEYDEHLFMVLHFPVYDRQAQVSSPSEVDFFIGKNFLVTVHCSGNLKRLSQFFRDCQTDETARRKYMGKGSGHLFHQIIDRLVDAIFPMLDKINDKIESLQDTVITRPEARTAQRILVVRHDIISMQRVVRPQIEVMDSLERQLKRRRHPFLEEDLGEYFGDVGDHLHKIRGVLEDQKDIIDSLSDTSNWLTSHRIQGIMRLLTMFLAVFTAVKLLSDMEGANSIPRAWVHNSPHFASAVAVQVTIVIGMVFLFHRWRWI